MPDFEKLGVFYLGRSHDLATRSTSTDLLLYESKDLLTHAVCVGMTGSGKTGLCIALIEEAAIDGIPALIVDPKGDLTNLLLTFPELRGADFLPWVNADDARAKGLTTEEHANHEAEAWRRGLESWDQDGARIQRLRDAAEFAIYTPASNAGRPVSILGSFAAPPAAILDDREAMRERVTATASSLLALVGIDADPLQSREHILLSTILDRAWRDGKDLDLPSIIHQTQSPPVSRIGVLDLDAFYPAKERFALAMQLNNLLASPGFEAWLEGEPLDLQRLLYTNAGKPRVAVVSIAHLGDAERMFIVSLLLNQTLSWMRSQSGTTSLRAILYMDEIFGYFPPVKNPPSKGPLLTLLKQARAFGLGVVLATQNPVDLDYKGLANAGTWFIGRLQTERDKLRLLDGLEGAAASAGSAFDRATMDRMMAGLGKRVFLMNNVHDATPSVFESRWTMSYLRGPLTRSQIKQLTGGPATAPKPEVEAAAAPARSSASGSRPVLSPDVPQYFAPAPPGLDSVEYRPVLLGIGHVRFIDRKMPLDAARELAYAAEFPANAAPVDWAQAAESSLAVAHLETTPRGSGRFVELPAAAGIARNYAGWTKSFADWLYRAERIRTFRSPSTGLASAVGESERDFRVRVQQANREERDRYILELKRKYAPKTDALLERLRRARETEWRETEEASAERTSGALSVGANLIGMLFGRKASVTRATRAVSRVRKESRDARRATETVASLRVKLNELEQQLTVECAEAQASFDSGESLEVVEIRPRRADVTVKLVCLVWLPASAVLSSSTC